MVILKATPEPRPPEIKGVNTERKVILEAKNNKEMYDHGHNKIHEKPDKSDQLEKGTQYSSTQPCGLGALVGASTTPPAQATPPTVSIEHNAAAATSPRQTKVNPENHSNLHDKEEDMANTRPVEMVKESVVDVKAHTINVGTLCLVGTV